MEEKREGERKSRQLTAREEEELKEEALKRLKETLLALDQWKRDSLASPIRY